MSITRHGIGSGPGGQPLPFARAVEADGWLWVSGQVPLKDGKFHLQGKVGGDISVDQAADAAKLCAINASSD